MPERKRRSYANVTSSGTASGPPTHSQQLPRRSLVVHDQVEPDYTLLHDLHGGAIGVVSMAWQRSLDRAVVLKRLPLPAAITRGNALVTEARICAHLNHPHIVTVHEVALDDDGQPFYVMRPVEGMPWSKTLRLNAVKANVDILIKVCDAIDYAHAQGVMHRDLKPDNVMIGQHGEIQVMDWGMAAGIPGNAHPLAPPLERHCTVSGTPAYMAPEMARGDGWLITTRSDIYLLGAILFEILTGAPPHAGTDAQEQLQAARNNQIRSTRIGGELIDIALRSMASDPHDRHCSVRALRDDIAHHECRARSRALTTRAVLAYERGVSAGDYHAFGLALFGFEEALGLWPGNVMAQDYLRRTRCSHASFAIEHDDLDLAASLLDGDDEETNMVRHRLAEARHQRTIDEEASRRLEHLAARHAAPGEESWHELCCEDFNDDSWQTRWQVVGGRATAVNGELVAAPAMPFVLLSRLFTGGDVRLEFDCLLTSEGGLNDLSCLFDCCPHADPRDCFTSGIEVKYACFDNSAVCCYQASSLVHHGPCRPVEPGRLYHVVASHLSGTVNMRVDGEEVLQVTLPPTAPLLDHNRCGLFGWGGDYRYRNLRVLVREPPMQSDLLDLAEHHLHKGRFSTASDLFDEVDAEDDPQRAKRLSRGQRQARVLRRREEELDAYRTRITDRCPGATVSLCGDGLQVSLSYCGIEDLSPLADIPVARLDISGNAITDLAPLADMPLTRLICNGNRIADLAPLRGMQLERLFCNSNLITDLTPLAGMSLVSFDAHYNRIVDLGSLADMPLRNVGLNGNEITDLRPLRALHLTTLRLDDNRIEDLQALAATKVRYLCLANNHIVDLGPLACHPAQLMSLSGNQIEDLRPLVDNKLHTLSVRSNRLTDLGPFAANPPPILSCSDNPFSDAYLDELDSLWADTALLHRNRVSLGIERALRSENADVVRALAHTTTDRSWLLVHDALMHDEALELAQRMNGHLICLERPDLLPPLNDYLTRNMRFWLGLNHGAEHWANGATLEGALALPPWVDPGTPLLFFESLVPQSRPDICAACIIEWSAS